MKQFAVAILLRKGDAIELTQAIIRATNRDEAAARVAEARQKKYPGYSICGELILEVPSIDFEPEQTNE